MVDAIQSPDKVSDKVSQGPTGRRLIRNGHTITSDEGGFVLVSPKEIPCGLG
jgi:hypothetical protein